MYTPLFTITLGVECMDLFMYENFIWYIFKIFDIILKADQLNQQYKEV